MYCVYCYVDLAIIALKNGIYLSTDSIQIPDWLLYSNEQWQIQLQRDSNQTPKKDTVTDSRHTLLTSFSLHITTYE